MRLLLDTHTLIWWLSDPGRLSRRAFGLVEVSDNDVLVSAASAYEIEYKRSRSVEIGRVPAELESTVVSNGFTWLALDSRHAVVAGRLPRLHGDPFDRLIAAQALVENLTLVTRDPAIRAYGAPVIW